MPTRLFKLASLIVFLSVLFLFNTGSVKAAACSFESLTDSSNNSINTLTFTSQGNITVASSTDCMQLGTDYYILLHPTTVQPNRYVNYSFATPNYTTTTDKRTLQTMINMNSLQYNNESTTWAVKVCPRSTSKENCSGANVLMSTTVQVWGPTPTPTTPVAAGVPIIDKSAQQYCLYQSGSSDVKINKISNLTTGEEYRWWWKGDWGTNERLVRASGTEMEYTIPQDQVSTVGLKTFCINRSGSMTETGSNCITLKLTAADPGSDRSCSAVSIPPDRGPSASASALPCAVGAEANKDQSEWSGVKTAIGCVPTRPNDFIKGLLRFAMGIGGGIALLLMIFGALQMITSAGSPESLKKGQEQFTSAIIGLLFIIFSVLLLQIIGADILGIPGFTR